MKKIFLILILSGLFFTLAAQIENGAENLAFRNIYGDNMVLQRNKPIKICGTADKGKNVKVTLADNSVTVTADAQGTWVAILPKMSHGGPYQLKIEGAKKEITLKNILIGDVWLCSGQSNMAMPVWSNRPFWNSKNGEEEAKNANFPEIRLFNVPVTFSPGKVQTQAPLKSSWQVCSPDTVKLFSAAGFYFARELYRELKIPIGVINSSRGASKIEPWISKEGYECDTQKANLEKILYAEENDISLSGKSEAIAKWVSAILKNYSREFVAAKKWKNRDYNDSDWEVIQGFDNISSETGAVWYRCKIELPQDWQNADFTVSFGILGGFDSVYFNGILVGDTAVSYIAPEKKQRVYTIRKTLVKKDNNVLTLRLLKIDKSKDFISQNTKIVLRNLKNGKILDVTENWKKRVEFEIDSAQIPPRPTAVTHEEYVQYPATLYNAMIAPFVAFPITGVIWYQGCSNAKEYKNYFELHKILVQNWRNKWENPQMPFIITQLSANERVSPGDRLPDDFWRNRPPMDYDWAKLREIQTAMLQVPYVGMAVTIDRGDHSDIHPADKQSVGYRLAREALRVEYNFTGISAGPIYKSMKIDGDKILLYFDNVGSGLVVNGEKLTAFAIAGADGKFVWADAIIDGDTVVVKSDKVPNPKHVRYAWAKYPGDITFFNKDGFPACPFRTDKPAYLNQ